MMILMIPRGCNEMRQLMNLTGRAYQRGKLTFGACVFFFFFALNRHYGLDQQEKKSLILVVDTSSVI